MARTTICRGCGRRMILLGDPERLGQAKWSDLCDDCRSREKPEPQED